MRDFFHSVKFKILLCVFALLFGLMIYAAVSAGVSTIPETFLKTITQPFVTAATSISSWVEDTLDKLVNADKYKRENEVLRRQLTEMYTQTMDKEEVDKENSRLKEMLNIAEERKDFEWSPPCSIIARSAVSVNGNFTINRGTNDGIKLYDPVFNEIGLVGIITKTAPTFSIVETILSTDIYIGVRTVENHVVGIIENDLKYTTERLCLMSYIEKGSRIKAGDMVVTAGGSTYPEGLILGQIKEIYNDDNGLSLHAVIEPAVDIFMITDVFVLTGFDGQGKSIEFEE